MSLPAEYVIEDAVRSIDEVIVYRANHPIHGTVNVYLPDRALPAGLSGKVKNRLYQSGLQMRDISLLNVGLLTKSLEVSQNPNEPYIVTKYSKHDIDELISNGVTLNPKRIFTILSQVLQAIISLESNDWILDQLYPRQIKLSELNTGDVNLTVIEGAEQRITVTKTIAPEEGDNSSATNPAKDGIQENSNDVPAYPTQGSSGTRITNRSSWDSETVENIDQTAIFRESNRVRQSRAKQKNIYLLGEIAYQLLFGRKYQSRSKTVVADIGTFAKRWRRVLEKTLGRGTSKSYDSYESMLRDVKKALNRNRRIAVASTPFWLILVIIGSYSAYEQYHQHKIMTSEAGQAIERFLEVINKTDDEFPELKRPKPKASVPDDKTILKPFNEIEGIEKD